MSSGNVKTTIALLTRNSAKTIEGVLRAIVSQTETDFEILCIDSSSTDDTVEIVKRYPARLIPIDSADFGHGKTRNYAIQQANGAYVVFLTHDSVPETTTWLEELLEPLRDPEIVGVYGRQVSRPSENPLDRHFQMSLYGSEPITWSKGNWKQGDNIFSDANSAVRRAIMLEHPYNQAIIVSEDYEWAARVLALGYKIQYSATARVIHSHSYDLRTLFRRNFDIGVSYQNIYTRSENIHFIKKGLQIFYYEVRSLSQSGNIHLVPLAALRDLTRLVAIQAGKHDKPFSIDVKRNHLSAQGWYWK